MLPAYRYEPHAPRRTAAALEARHREDRTSWDETGSRRTQPHSQPHLPGEERRLAAGSGNAVLFSLLEGMSGPTARARLWRGRIEEGAVARARQQHRAIYEAVAARQP
ncbi:FCD domain-containing protein [Streptomyces sp. NPDC085529]|uniref:FCD domain-containing protein n=1 Tax=Streptomyces sp. NPDC085529 TaxID=3365729 RepID=UPI0037D166EC